MSISKDAYDFINNYIDFFNYFNKDQEINKKIIQKLYLEIIDSKDFADSFKSINKEVTDIEFGDQTYIEDLGIKKFTTFTSSHTIESLRNVKKKLVYSFTINNIEYQLIFLILTEKDEAIIDRKISIFIKNLHFVSKYMKAKMNSLKIVVLYAYKNKEKNNDTNKPLSFDNVNTGVTRSCIEDSIIFLYRQEELMKVFIHEVIHSKCVDFSNIDVNKKTINLIKKMFDIKSDFVVSESYCEFWANIINTLFVSLQVSENNFDSFYENFNLLHIMEKIFSLHQIISVLDYMGLTYKDLISGKNTYKFKEETNVFAYYILKSIWLFFSREFMGYMNKKNENLITAKSEQKYIYDIIKYTMKLYDNPKLLNIIKNIENRYHKQTGDIKNSLLMTILIQK